MDVRITRHIIPRVVGATLAVARLGDVPVPTRVLGGAVVLCPASSGIPCFQQLFAAPCETVFLTARPRCVGVDHLDQLRSQCRVEVILAERRPVGKSQLGHEVGRTPW